jgi:hypothetical protein
MSEPTEVEIEKLAREMRWKFWAGWIEQPHHWGIISEGLRAPWLNKGRAELKRMRAMG